LVATQPKYLIEKMSVIGSSPTRIAYRITAYGSGSKAGVAMVQSVYVKQF
jgi:Tfp pilus assembly protein PilX